MKLAARIFLLISGMLLLAHYLPAGYWLVADKRQRAPFVFYSCVQKNFLLYRYEPGGIVRVDPSGTVFEREEFERLLPLDNYMQLYKDGRMPKEIGGVAITPEKLRRERVNARIKPEDYDSPSVPLAPLFEAENGRARLEMPGDMMRLGGDIEFIDAKSNRVLSEKSAKFRKAFSAAGFVFPVRLSGGNPSALKPYDEGCYLVDSAGAFFRLRQVKGEPELIRITDIASPEEKNRWAQLSPRFLHVQEQDNRELRLLIIGEDNRVHLAIGTNFHLVTLPLNRFNPAKMALTLRGDLLNRLVTVVSGDYIEAVVMNRDYAFVDRYSEPLVPRRNTPSGRRAAFLFPFTLDFESANSGFLGFHFAWSGGPFWAANLAFVALLTGGLFWRKRPLRLHWPELVATAIGGIYGFILAWLLPQTETVPPKFPDKTAPSKGRGSLLDLVS
jgi:hypothetical protein